MAQFGGGRKYGDWQFFFFNEISEAIMSIYAVIETTKHGINSGIIAYS